MGKETKIAWTDSTMNFWWGCQKVGPGCDHCYAEAVDKRAGGVLHWGPGVDRRRTSEHNWNDAYRWNRNAPKFMAEHGRRQRVFASSMSDIFDNAVPLEWARDAFHVMETTPNLDWQPLTKRVGMVEKRIPDHWKNTWPRHVGLMITCVNQEEFLRDSGKLVKLKCEFDIPWVGISYEPAQGPLDIGYPLEVWPNGPQYCCNGFECGCRGMPTEPPLCWGIDWIIAGGESGAGWRPAEIEWFHSLKNQCAEHRVKFFMKQISGFRPREEDIPADLLVREFPEWER